ncbi:hypothetical protein SRABI27_05029 [Pedobacter sp. Bi27]|uniref:hypothetical protein n=1 Tax=Pedobacter sp. Bi27 TaxID=2822351 RepID=UPI001DCAFC1E|nr:hypothetical protein [Pedobacter sp. Bi27]CAH0316522.1 hypothetical protein SRABI27_05029 [Pedobacter sp. Bi27]
MNKDITDKIGKALDGILKSKQSISEKEQKIQARSRAKITIDRSRPINVSDLDQNEEVDKEIRKLEKEITVLKETIRKSKDDLYRAVSAYEGNELNVHYSNEYRTLKVKKIKEDLYGEEDGIYEIIYNGGEL